MKITRLRVEEGFFDGLDLRFGNGLNVLIGGRGVGKTSIIELIRFGLGVKGVTAASEKESLTHALAVLKSGQVTIDLEMDGSEFTVTRSASDDFPRSNMDFLPPIIFSQKEIESVGLDALGRLALIDSFSSAESVLPSQLTDNSAQIRSVTIAMVNLRKEIDEVADKSQNLKGLKQIEAGLLTRQNEFSVKNKEIKESQDVLDSLHEQLSRYSVDQNNLTNFYNAIQDRMNSLQSVKQPPVIQDVYDEGALKVLQGIGLSLSKDKKEVDALIEKNSDYGRSVQAVIELIKNKALQVEDRARGLRGLIEKYNEGAGSVSRELGSIRKNIAQAENLRKINLEKKSELERFYLKCNKLAEKLGDLRKKIYEQRKAVIGSLNDKLSPTIMAEINHLSKLGAYETALSDTLRGSGLKYKEIIPLLASKISPHELLEMVYEDRYEEFADILEVPADRAARLLGYLKEYDLGLILTANIEDDIQLMLLDGADYKNISDLSIGQRCTVALSIVLENESRVLLIDQPEDHLDNEFIADTLILALSQRVDKAQTIVCSHNANIPVLGEANNVVSLDSNGRRGFVKFEGGIDSPDIKSSIETIMEGGKDAFAKRAAFYST